MSTEKCKISGPGANKPQNIAVSDTNIPSDALHLEVEGLAAGGRGVARSSGVVWFLPGGFPGDRVLAVPEKHSAAYVEGRILAVLSPSPARRNPPCPLQSSCGGCPWMGLDDAEQRVWKRTLVREALFRIGRTDVEIEPLRAGARTLGYRNKLELTLGRTDAGRPVVGFHAARPDRRDLVDVDRCPVQPDAANAVLATARQFLLGESETWSAGTRVPREPFRLLLRSSATTGEILVGLRETRLRFAGLEALARRLREAHPQVVGVVRIRARAGRRGGARTERVSGRSSIVERIGATEFRVPAASFIQVNTEGAELLLDAVRECAGRVTGLRLVDLYGGVGAFGIELARDGARVTVCEADAAAVRCGREAARKTLKGQLVDFVHADVGVFLRDRLPPGGVDLVVANPPRSGLGPEIPRAIARLEPARVVMVSCDPATLARDTRRLCELGFTAERAIPVDLFPQTAHVETVLSLRRATAPEPVRGQDSRSSS